MLPLRFTMPDYTSFISLVLLADDDVNDRLLFKDAIQHIDLNISLKMFDDGSGLMNYLLNEYNVLPDLIFLNLCMPQKNGFQCLEEIRNHERLKHLSIIIYSTSSKLENIEAALNKGANLYFSKSSTFQELINRLKRILAMNWEKFNPETSMEKFVLSDEAAF